MTSYQLIFGQTLKTYSGIFEEGKATYQYYENENFDRFFHGNFSYNGSLYNMVGLFNNNNRDGNWTISAVEKISIHKSLGSVKVNAKVIGTYDNGNLNGNWSYYNSIIHVSPYTKKPFSPDDEGCAEISKATFKNNNFVGKFSYQSNCPKQYSINGQFDNKGIIDGTWSFVTSTEKTEIRFLKGIAIWKLRQNITNGEKLEFYDKTNFVIDFWNSYDTINNTSIVDGKVYILDTLNANYDGVEIWRSDNDENPLYHYKLGCKKPMFYEIAIKDCEVCNQRIIEKQREEASLKLELERDAIIKKANEEKAAKELEIFQLNKSRYDLFMYSYNYYESSRIEAANLAKQLESVKGKYSISFLKCIDVLNRNCSQFFTQINTLCMEQGTYGIAIQETWNFQDDIIFEKVKNLKEATKEKELFINNVKKALIEKNKEKLKFFSNVENPYETIKAFQIE
jgi:hypothetical protein